MASSKSKTLKPKQPERLAKTLPEGVRPLKVDWGPNDVPALIHFSDGQVSLGSCIRCAHPPCMRYENRELDVAAFKDFPSDRNAAVCPTGAITWPIDGDSPVVDPDSCISCGLCVSRCPTRAIHLDENGAHVNDEANEHFQIRDFLATEESTRATARQFRGVDEEGSYRIENDEIFGRFFEHLVAAGKDQGAQFPSHLARNLMIACGIGAAMRRRGDTNIRMEMVLGPPGVKGGTAEVELGVGVLDAPRNILDNVAVLAARYGVAKELIVPVIDGLTLPNSRSEYWSVIRDIRSVLDVKINSINVGILVLLLWNRVTVTIEEGDEFYVDADSPSLRPEVERILNRVVDVSSGYPNLLETQK